MTLILNILDNKRAVWRAFDKTLEKKHEFAMILGEDNVLSELDVFLKEYHLDLKDFNGIALSIKEASLTQVKVIVTIINTLAWQLNIPVAGSFYENEEIEEINKKLIAKLKNAKEFIALIPEYQRAPEITISQKTPNFEIEL